MQRGIGWVRDRVREVCREPRLAYWVGTEIPRRLVDRALGPRSEMALVLSYPRSGNHAIRYFLEYSFARPTLGLQDDSRFLVPRGLGDPPMFVRRGVRIRIHSRDPVAKKLHKPPPPGSRYSCLVLIVRDPEAAILSNMVDFSDGDFSGRLTHEVNQWRSVAEFWDGFAGPKTVVPYDGILHGDAHVFERVARVCGHADPVTVVRSYLANGPRQSLVALRRPPQTLGYDPMTLEDRFSARRELLRGAIESAGLVDRYTKLKEQAH